MAEMEELFWIFVGLAPEKILVFIWSIFEKISVFGKYIVCMPKQCSY